MIKSKKTVLYFTQIKFKYKILIFEKKGKKLFSLKRRKSSASSNSLKKEELKPATAIIAGLIERNIDKDSFEVLKSQLQSTKTDTPWFDLFLRLDGIDSIFHFLYPYERCAQ